MSGEGGDLHADQRVFLLHRSLRRGDVGTAFQQRGGQAGRQHRDLRRKRRWRNGQVGWRVSGQDGNRMLELLPLHANGDQLRLGRLKQCQRDHILDTE
jgi:hypothetical protein